MLRAERDGIVIGHRALMGEAADVVELQIRRQEPIGGPGLRGGARKACIVAWEKGLQDGIGLVKGAGLGKAEFTDEPVLEGAPESFDAALRLRGVSGDPLDAQLAQGAANLGGRSGVATELLVEGEGPGAGLIGNDAVPIAIEGDGNPMGADQRPEHDEVAMGIFLRPEDGGGDRVGGIIDGALEDQAGAAPLEPVVVAAVPLEEQARLRHAGAAAAEATGPSRPWTGETGGQQDPMDRGAREDDAVDLGEFLGQMLVIESGIGRAGQPYDATLKGSGNAIGGGAAPVPMGQGGRPVPTEGRQ